MRFNLAKYWYDHSLHLWTIFLLPFSWLFAGMVWFRRILYRLGMIKTYHFNIPVIVVGNITVGGTGKTPFVIWLAQFLRDKGYHPGIVSRGIGGQPHYLPYQVQVNDSPTKVGDEAILLTKNTNCPIVIGINRAVAAAYLLQHTNCDVIISDDGLQHYRLGRDIEIAIVDGQRYFGNQHFLPAGPLREPISRLEKVDFVVVNGGEDSHYYAMVIEPRELVSLQNEQIKFEIANFPHKQGYAVAGIGHPERFFNLLEENGFELIPHIFPDHHLYQAKDFNFAQGLPVLMTEKDAVKCESLANERYWYLKIDVKIDKRLQEELLLKISTLKR